MNTEQLFRPKVKTDWNIISLGAGVQSSAMALMAASGLITPMPDCAIFADTGAEPQAVYRWLDWLEKHLPFPVHRVAAKTSLTDDIGKAGVREDGTPWVKQRVPAFLKNADSTTGMMPRHCTRDYKILPIERVTRDIAQPLRGEKRILVTQWIGISWDEMQRAKESRVRWIQHRFPLLERRWRRDDCLKWMTAHGYPAPPRSACVFCPYHSNAEWRRLKREDPEGFKQAVRVERKLQTARQTVDSQRSDAKGSVPYFHRSCVPLDQVDLTTDEEKGQKLFGFDNECEGMCGV